MKVTDFASRNPVSLYKNDSLLSAVKVFLKYGIDGVPIINDNGEIAGLLTKTHLYRAIVGHVPMESAVGSLMKREVKTIRSDRPVEDAWQMAWEQNIGRLPVVDGDNRLVAMMTRTDLVRAFELLYQDLDAIINSSYDGIVVVDENGAIVKYNEAFKNLLAEAAGTQQGTIAIEELLSQSGLKRTIMKVSRTAIQNKMPASMVQRFETGKEILVTANPVYAKKISSKIPRVVVNCRDISSLTDLRRQLEATRELSEVYQSELETLKTRALGHTFVCGSDSMRKVYDLAIRVARVDSTILILGESGAGKEIVAGLIHKMSHRAGAPFIRINCGAIPENLLESELFGYEGGAFSGARREGKPGLFELAHSGTLFLDEVSELPLTLQVKLLTVIQEREVVRVGGTRPFKVDLRLVAASNRDLEAAVKSGRFRADLYYRLNVVPVVIPPLRERREEIPLFISHFLRKFNEKYYLTKSIAAEVIDILCGYHWPGNVRELENLIERLTVVTASDLITVRDLPVSVIKRNEFFRNGDYHAVPEKEMIRELYGRLRSTRKVAEMLGVNQSTVVRKMKKYNIRATES